MLAFRAMTDRTHLLVSARKEVSVTKQSSSTTSETGSNFGPGGERHQDATGDNVITTNHGVPVSDNQNSLRAGPLGPVLLEDYVLREKVFHFDHERIPERVVHARGSGAHGVFECTKAIPKLTSAHVFQEVGRTVPVFARFSTVAGGSGSADTPRDVRGFAVKFYTEQGNWDLVGNNIPVFFIQDAIKFPDLVHAVKMEADRGYPQAASAHDTFWDFASLMPETTHMLLWAMSDRTLPRSLRMMDGFGVHTYQFVNAKGDACFVKFHWRPELGVQSTLWDEAVKIAGADPDFHRRDLYESIATGDYPSWELGVQIFDQALADSLPWSVLDATKLIPEELVPVEVIGRMTLNRNPDNFFAETEQVAFLPTNIVPGIDFSDDPLLQGRLFSYLDTQKSRLGTTNFHQIPINAPQCPSRNFQRDGMMQVGVPQGRANYEPNSLGAVGEEAGPREAGDAGFRTVTNSAGLTESPAKVRQRSELFADHYSQAAMFWESQTEIEQAHIASAFAFELGKVSLPHVRERTLANLGNVSPELASRVAVAVGDTVPSPSPAAASIVSLEPSDAVSILKRGNPPLRGRKIAVLIADGTTKSSVLALSAEIMNAGATVTVVAPSLRVNNGRSSFDADARLDASPSVLFDAVALLLTAEAAETLAHHDAAVQFVSDAFVHLKAIGHTEGSLALMERAGVKPDAGVTDFASFIDAAPRRYFEREPSVRALA
jgi:catalase